MDDGADGMESRLYILYILSLEMDKVRWNWINLIVESIENDELLRILFELQQQQQLKQFNEIPNSSKSNNFW